MSKTQYVPIANISLSTWVPADLLRSTLGHQPPSLHCRVHEQWDHDERQHSQSGAQKGRSEASRAGCQSQTLKSDGHTWIVAVSPVPWTTAAPASTPVSNGRPANIVVFPVAIPAGMACTSQQQACSPACASGGGRLTRNWPTSNDHYIHSPPWSFPSADQQFTHVYLNSTHIMAASCNPVPPLRRCSVSGLP
jgi:hypothetical protein